MSKPDQITITLRITGARDRFRDDLVRELMRGMGATIAKAGLAGRLIPTAPPAPSRTPARSVRASAAAPVRPTVDRSSSPAQGAAPPRPAPTRAKVPRRKPHA